MSTIAEQQRATTEVLKLIGSSSGGPQEVFASILASAARICDADNGAINRWDGEALHLVATHNMPRSFIELREQSRVVLQAATPSCAPSYLARNTQTSHGNFSRNRRLQFAQDPRRGR